ncbi:MAG: hypothetical protein LBF00_02900 [Mycoplasmataceae bacterium]|jgi:hypothetical protein|nr:hypothetical protein [Mycoplasmataceae bacterium]
MICFIVYWKLNPNEQLPKLNDSYESYGNENLDVGLSAQSIMKNFENINIYV